MMNTAAEERESIAQYIGLVASRTMGFGNPERTGETAARELCQFLLTLAHDIRLGEHEAD